MARLEIFGRTFGCRVMMLLFWTIFVCCFLYLSRGSRSPNKSLEYPNLSKRFSANHSRLDNNQCKTDAVTQKDFEILRRMFGPRKQHLGKPAVHCTVLSLCDSVVRYRAECYLSECLQYEVRSKDDSHRIISSQREEELSDLLEASLRENSFMIVEDLNRYLDVYCQKPVVSKMELTGDILTSRNCQRMKQGTSNKRQATAPRFFGHPNVHLLFFRFLSQWELPVRFPGLSSLLDKSARDRRANVLNFDKQQATEWEDVEMLSLLLQGNTGQFKVKGSLLETLLVSGYCFRLEDLSCGKSREQDALVANLTSVAGGIVCKDVPLRHREIVLDKLCQEGNLTESMTRSVLTSLLSSVHDLDDLRSDLRPIVSVSVLNTKDFKNPGVLDYILSNIYVDFLNKKERLLMILGGVGNPTFLRFDQSARLQTQASNPAMVLISTGNLSTTTSEDVRRLNESTFSMRIVHNFVKRLVQNEAKTSDLQNTSLGVSDGHGERNSCESLKVKPPFICLCEEQFVDYENDTLMVGFAEFAVSVINAQIQHSQSDSSSLEIPSQCARLSGVSFSNVRVGRHGDKRRLLMDLFLEDELSKDRIFRKAVLDLWNNDKVPRAEIHFYAPDSTTSFAGELKFQTERFLKTLCKRGQSLSSPITSETSLLKHWSEEKHFGRQGRVLHVHDNCLYMNVRDFGDSVSVEAGNVCRDRQYDVMLHLSLMNMISLSPLPLSVSLGHAQREYLTVIVKVSYTVPTFAYKLHPDFDVSYDN